MSDLTLVIGNKNYSSWSLRPWLLLRHVGLAFREVQILLDTPTFKSELAQWSPAGRVPILKHGELAIWDSLAICEYACELTGRGWPRDSQVRAVARAISAEMHSGFQAMRGAWPMNIRAHQRRVTANEAVLADVSRIDASWSACRERYGGSGGWLFGDFSVADAMYAPVVLRFRTYEAPLSPIASAYCDHVLADPVLRDWISAAEAEPWVVPADEAG